MKKAMIAFLLAVLCAPAAFAHEGHDEQVLGTVEAVERGSISIKTKDGKTVPIAMDDETVVLRGEQKVTSADVAVGERAVVSVGTKAGKHVATRIRLGPKRGQ
jgi:hypothetical protein